MNKFLKYLCLYIPLILIVVSIIGSIIIFSNQTFNVGNSKIIDANLSAQLGNLYGGFIGTILSASSVFLLIYTIFHQKIESQKNNLENNFFKMLDYHNQHLNYICIPHLNPDKGMVEGKRAFIQFKIQFKNILEITKATLDHKNIDYTQDELADISYIIFYYGLEGSWTTFILNKCKNYHFIDLVTLKEIQQKLNQKIDKKLVRANQTYLSSYFRNMYNAVKMIDESDILTLQEKKNLIKILRAQLSNPELYVLFFNIISRFGKKWIENNFIEKYELIKNIPYDYCEGYDPTIYFPSIKFEEDEY